MQKMQKTDAIQILDALAAGCSPKTGNILPSESIFNDREVIRALQYAISILERVKLPQTPTPSVQTTPTKRIHIEESDLREIINFLSKQQIRPTYHRISYFLLGYAKAELKPFTSHELYGKYRRIGHKEALILYLKNNHNALFLKKKENVWDVIDFFEKEVFNNLSPQAIEQLKQKISLLEMKVKNPAEYVKKARVNHPRAYEPWSEAEKKLLSIALEHTNDKEFLAQSFQRGANGMVDCGKRLLYFKEKKEN